MIKHMIINVSQIIAEYLNQAKTNKVQPRRQKRTKANSLSLSLEAYDLYIFLPLWQQVTKKFIENA